MLPSELETRMTVADYWEMVAFFEIRAEAEKAAHERARRESELRSRRR